MHDVLNFFDPDPDIPAYYENQLTRAYLVVLRLSPAAHQVWLSLAAPGRNLYQLPRPWTFDTQRWQVFDSPPDLSEPVQGISVLQAADADDVSEPVHTTDRAQVLDGIVRYGDELVIVIETKLGGRVRSDQAQYLNVHGAAVRFDEPVRVVSWRDLLAAWCDLIEREIVTGAERAIIADFLDYVERHFQRLGPFTTLSRCKGNAFRVKRRLTAIMDELAGGLTRPWIELPGRATLDRALLQFDEAAQRIILGVWPADTLTQAKQFYDRPDAIAAVLALQEAGWRLRPNFHFGFMASGLVWTTPTVPVEDYVAYWRDRVAGTRAVPREDWETMWAELVRSGSARADDKAQFDQGFTDTARSVATPRPGVACAYGWTLAQAERLDDGGRLVGAVAEQLDIVLHALDEKPLKVAPTSDGG